MKPFVLALGGGLVGFASDRRDAQTVGVSDQLAQHATADGVQRITIIGEQSLRHAARFDAFAEDPHCILAVLGLGGQ